MPHQRRETVSQHGLPSWEYLAGVFSVLWRLALLLHFQRGFQLGDDGQIFRSAGGLLRGNQQRERKNLHVVTGNGLLLRLVNNFLVSADGRHCSKQIQGFVTNFKRKVRAELDRAFIKEKGQVGWEA